LFRSLRTIRSIPRIKDIALVLGKHGFHQVAGALQAPVTTRLRRLFKQEPRHVVQQPERLRMVLEDLGPTFIKFGQLLSTRPDILPQAYLMELGRLQDDVHPAPFDEIRLTLEEEFGARPDEVFRSIHPEPLAAASIAQVHRAVTRDGAEVVVKVRRRGLERVVEQDLLVLGLLAEFLKDWPGLRLFDPEGILRLFERSIRRELNFDYERNNLVRLRQNLPEDSPLYIPRPYPELSRSGVLTMEFLAGDKLSGLRESRLDRERRETLARQLAIGILKQIFEDGLFHADPHPGNIILLGDGRIGLIDVGNVGRMTRDMMDDLVTLLLALVQRDYRGIAAWILKRGQPSKEVDAPALALDLMDQLEPYYGLSLGEIRLGDLFNALFGMVLRYGIRVPPQYVLVGRTFMTLEGSVRLCAPQLEIVPQVQPYVTQVMKERWAPARLLREVEAQASELAASLRSFPANLAEVLARAATGRLRVESRNPDLEKVERKLDLVATKVPLALITSALMLSSALLLCLPAGQRIPAALGIGGLVAAFFLALRVLLR
jgi:ubiquinone biosynthesis protein